MSRNKDVPLPLDEVLSTATDAEMKRLEEQRARLKTEVARLTRIYKDVDPAKRKLVKATIEDVAFCSIMMEDLRMKLMLKGTTMRYQNGENQYGEKQSPDAQLYLQTSQKLCQNMKILKDLFPEQTAAAAEGDGFDEFVYGRED